MISESQQEQASLYALGLLDADEAVAFERELDADAELREFVREIQDTIALLAWAGDRVGQSPPPELKRRILAETRTRGSGSAAPSRTNWQPWAWAALFLACAGVLWVVVRQQESQIARLQNSQSKYVRLLADEKSTRASENGLAQVSFCALEPTPDFKTTQPRAMVLWDAVHRQGKLRVNRLAPPAEGKDYQLWTVETGRKDPVSAGVFRVDADGKADVPFQPVEADGKPVAAVAVSLEQAGGSPTNQGPILLLGKF